MPNILHPDLFPLGYPLLRRAWFLEPGLFDVVAPLGTTWIRASASPAGGFKDDVNGWGGGGAFAFDEEACAELASFSVQVGDSQFCRPAANTEAGDSWVKRAGGTVLVSADRGRPDGTPGLADNCVGSVVRSGQAAAINQGGASAGDDGDALPLGFGGRGASATVAAWYGGGGGRVSGSFKWPMKPAGDGRVCLEFFRRNPDLDL